MLEGLASEHPFIRPLLRGLHVLSREFTGVGSFTTFSCETAETPARSEFLGLSALISMPTVPSGMGAVLWCHSHRPQCLEIYVYGDTFWDGLFDGFAITPSRSATEGPPSVVPRPSDSVSVGAAWACCFCGASNAGTGWPLVTLRVTGKDSGAQELRAHAACLKQRLHPGIPFLPGEDSG